MADLDLSSSSQLVQAPPKRSIEVEGQAALFSVALSLGVPVFSRTRNVELSWLPNSVGLGASFAVSKATQPFIADRAQDFVNGVSASWFKRGNVLHHVTKGLVSVVDPHATEAHRLAPILNEIRILSVDSIRKHSNIVPLLGISWFERPIRGRYWPQLVIEAAPLGTLHDYMINETPGVATRFHLAMDVTSAIEFLHAQKVVHRDIKPANVLLYSEQDSTTLEQNIALKIAPLTAKVCDFGFATILTDYDKHAIFKGRIGTLSWMAPEVYRAEEMQLQSLEKTDCYSLGLLVGSLFLERPEPFQNLSEQNIVDLKESPGAVAEKIMHDVGERSSLELTEDEEIFLARILHRTLVIEPIERWAAGLVIQDLDNALKWRYSMANAHLEPEFAELGPKVQAMLQFSKGLGTFSKWNLRNRDVLISIIPRLRPTITKPLLSDNKWPTEGEEKWEKGSLSSVNALYQGQKDYGKPNSGQHNSDGEGANSAEQIFLISAVPDVGLCTL